MLWASQGAAPDEPASPEKVDSSSKAEQYLTEKDDSTKGEDVPPHSRQQTGSINIPQTVVFKQGHMEDWFFSKVRFEVLSDDSSHLYLTLVQTAGHHTEEATIQAEQGRHDRRVRAPEPPWPAGGDAHLLPGPRSGR